MTSIVISARWRRPAHGSSPTCAGGRSSPPPGASSPLATTPTPRWRRSPAEAGVTRGLVNHYFGTKRKLYLAVVADLAAELPGIVRTDLGDRPIELIVELNLARFLDAVERDFELWSILLGSGAAERDPEVAAIVASARDEVIERMARNHAGSDAGEELRLALRAFLGAAIAASEEWLVRGRASRPQVEALLRRALLAMAAGAQPA